MRHRCLLLDRRRDLLVLLDDPAHRGEDIAQCLLHLAGFVDRARGHLMAAAHGLDRRTDTLLQALDHLGDFFG
ncbi:hypothetical protein D3C80_1901440 [compost metagenome]